MSFLRNGMRSSKAVIDEYLGTSYDIIKAVHDSLGDISAVAPEVENGNIAIVAEVAGDLAEFSDQIEELSDLISQGTLFTSKTETQLGSQAVARTFTLTTTEFDPTEDTLYVFRNGLKLNKGRDYTTPTSTTILIETTVPINPDDNWDFVTNLAGTNNFANARKYEAQLGNQATAGVFTLQSLTYNPGTNNLTVEQNGQVLIRDKHFQETSSTSVTLLTTVNDTDDFVFKSDAGVAINETTTASVSHTSEGQTVNLQDYLDGLGAAAMYPTVNEMFLGSNELGQVYSAGGTLWKVDSISAPMTISNYSALDSVNIAAFGATEDGTDIGPALQAAVDYTTTRGKDIVINGIYTLSSTVALKNRTTIIAESSKITVTGAITDAFTITVPDAFTTIEYVTIEGGLWQEGDGTGLGSINLINAQGTYNSGSPRYVNRSHFNRMRVIGFNQFLKSDFHRSWNVTNCFIRCRNGIRLEHKNVETNISNCIIFGTDTLDTSTVGIDVGVGINGTTHPGMYPEGLKINNCTIDQFGKGLHVHEVLDMNVTDNWIGAGSSVEAVLNNHCVAFEINPDGNNFMSGLHFNHNTYARAKIEFIGHTGAPTQTFIQMSDEIYLSAQEIDIGLRWHNIHMDNWVFQRAFGATSPDVGINCVNENEECTFTNLKFFGTWSSLIQVKGSLSTGVNIDNVWSDEFIDDPFYIETPIKVTNSSAAKPVAGTPSKGGQIIYMDEIPTGTTYTQGTNVFESSNLRFKRGSLVEVKIQGIVNNTSASGALEIKDTVGGVVESMAKGTGWDSKFIMLDDDRVRLDATYVFRSLSDTITTIAIESLTGDSSFVAHSHVTIRYL